MCFYCGISLRFIFKTGPFPIISFTRCFMMIVGNVSLCFYRLLLFQRKMKIQSEDLLGRCIQMPFTTLSYRLLVQRRHTPHLNVIIWFSRQSKIHRLAFAEWTFARVVSFEPTVSSYSFGFFFGWMCFFSFDFFSSFLVFVRQSVSAIIDVHRKTLAERMSDSVDISLTAERVCGWFFFHFSTFSLSLPLFFSQSRVSHSLHRRCKVNEKPFGSKSLVPMWVMPSHLIFVLFFVAALRDQQNMIHTVDVIYFCQFETNSFGSSLLNAFVYISKSSWLANYRQKIFSYRRKCTRISNKCNKIRYLNIRKAVNYNRLH